MPSSIERTLDYFEKADDALAGQLVLEGVDLAFLQNLFGMPQDNPMIEVFPVSPEQAEALRPYVSEDLDLVRYDYYLDCSEASVLGAESPSRTPTYSTLPRR